MLAWSAISAMSLHTGAVVVDWAIGIAVAGLPILAVIAGLRALAWIVRGGLRRLAPRTPPRVGTVLAGFGDGLRALLSPAAAAVICLAALTWGSGESGPLSIFHFLWFAEIPIVLGLVAGGLAGAAIGVARLSLSRGRRRQLVTALLVPALALGTGGGIWTLSPGMGDPITRESWTGSPIGELDLPDPSKAGPHAVATATYGSGDDARRREFGVGADWLTSTVDASSALEARVGVARAYADWFWGFDAARLPVNGRVWYPETMNERAPLVLIVHGNHTAGDFSDPGYAYLAEHLASHGMVAASVDQNYLNGDSFFDYAGGEMAVRAWLVLRHLEEFRSWNADSSHPLGGRIDLNRVGLVGHSRGGEAVALAAEIESTPDSAVAWLPEVPRGFGIQAVVALAPSDGMYTGGYAPVDLTDVDYLVIQGAHDGDLPSFAGLRTYHRVTFSGRGDHLKVALYSQRANHGRFNEGWDAGDAGPLVSWLLDRGSLLSSAEQQHLAKATIGAFLARSLQGATGYDAFFREPRAGRAWLPDDIIETHWATSARTVIHDFDRVRDESAPAGAGFDRVAAADPGLRDRSWQADLAAHLVWSDDSSLAFAVSATQAARLASDDALVFSLVAAGPGQMLDPTIELATADGRTFATTLGATAPARPLLAVRLWKLDALGARYLPGERLEVPYERFMQTYPVPLAAFGIGERDIAGVRSITFRFEGHGDAYLDDLAIEPAVASTLASQP